MKLRILLLMMFTLLGGMAFSQNVLDGVYVKEHTVERQVIPYPFLREADVMWSKRIWRVIDLNEKMNLPLRYPSSKQTTNRKQQTATANNEQQTANNEQRTTNVNSQQQTCVRRHHGPVRHQTCRIT